MFTWRKVRTAGTHIVTADCIMPYFFFRCKP